PPRTDREYQAAGEIHAEHPERELRDAPCRPLSGGEVQPGSDGAGIQRIRQPDRDRYTDPPHHRLGHVAASTAGRRRASPESDDEAQWPCSSSLSCTTITGHCACFRRLLEVLPSSLARRPLRPREPTTMAATSRERATLRIVSGTVPSSATASA